MSIELTNPVIKLFKETASQLKGAARRRFLFPGCNRVRLRRRITSSKRVRWDRNTIRKGIKELTSGITCVDNYSAKGRYKAEEHLPNLLEDIKKLVDSQSQTESVTRNDGSTANYIGSLYDKGSKLNYIGTNSGAIVNLKGERIRDY